MIDNSYAPVAAEQIVTKVRPKAPNFVRDIKQVRVDDDLAKIDQSVEFRDYVEVIDGVTVTYWGCPVTYDLCVGSRMDDTVSPPTMRDNWWLLINYNTAECQCVTWK